MPSAVSSIAKSAVLIRLASPQPSLGNRPVSIRLEPFRLNSIGKPFSRLKPIGKPQARLNSVGALQPRRSSAVSMFANNSIGKPFSSVYSVKPSRLASLSALPQFDWQAFSCLGHSLSARMSSPVSSTGRRADPLALLQ